MISRTFGIPTRHEGIGARALRRALPIAGFAALTALAAQVKIPIGLVPATLQPAAVLAAGLVLGARGGAASQALYLAVGFAGLPVFALGGGRSAAPAPAPAASFAGRTLAAVLSRLFCRRLVGRLPFVRIGVGGWGPYFNKRLHRGRFANG